ncbi:hypothetical protein [Actinomadura sp. 9N407]|uniref:hypothetical protein n=1 Tax=Actinomadura sp. 9N407 TaxID=3375154 RepID=UPI0037986197
MADPPPGTPDESGRPAFEKPDPFDEPAPDDAVPAPEPGTPRARRPGGRVLIGIGAGAMVLLLLAITPALNSRADGIEGAGAPLKAALRAPDRVPAGPVVAEIPQGCGLSEKVRDRLAPRGEPTGLIFDADSESCTWETGAIAWSLGGGNRTLAVRIDKGNAGVPSPVSVAMDDFARALDARPDSGSSTARGAVRKVTGLGDEAVTLEKTGRDTPGNETRTVAVVFRGGNIVVQVEYGGADYAGDGARARPDKVKALDAKAALDGAFMAAADIAENMRLALDARPAVAGERHRPPPLRRVPPACGLLSGRETEDLDAPGAPYRQKYALLLDKDFPGADLDRCSWDLSLNAEIASIADTEAAGGTEAASRAYLREYHRSRASGPVNRPHDVDFHPLAGIGDEAFIVFGRDGVGDEARGQAEVLFRVRNTLVRIECEAYEGSAVEALDRAYAAAVKAARRVGP